LGPRAVSVAVSISSQKRSAESLHPAVMPHAAWPLWPVGKAGLPTKDAPATAHSGVRTWARYQGAGIEGARCGSLARIGLPLAVRAPAIAQAFDAPDPPTTSRRSARSAPRRSSAGPTEEPTGAVAGSQSP
jgi:hypothetical protein